MTAPRYRAPNTKEVMTILATTLTEPDGTTDGNPRRIMAAALPASAEARTYFHTTAMTEAMARRPGRPAYHSAGTVTTQKDATQATAIPTGPHRRPSSKSRPVTANSTTPQRNHRSARPMEMWIQLWME